MSILKGIIIICTLTFFLSGCVTHSTSSPIKFNVTEEGDQIVKLKAKEFNECLMHNTANLDDGVSSVNDIALTVLSKCETERVSHVTVFVENSSAKEEQKQYILQSLLNNKDSVIESAKIYVLEYRAYLRNSK